MIEPPTIEQSLAFPTKVHPPETNVGPSGYPPLWELDLSEGPIQSFRHSGWAIDRRKVWEGLCYFTASEKRLRRFSECGLHPHVYRSLDPPYVYKVAGDSCHDRFCVPCARQRGNLIAANIMAKLNGRPCRFVTLTLRSATEPLTFLIDKIQQSFRLLRQTSVWNASIHGGVAFIESKWNPEGQRWHVHLHALVQGSWINKPELEQQWRRITQGSYICDIQLCGSPERVTKYVVKYCSKPYDHSVILDPVRLVEALGAFHRRRLFTTFGTWRGVPLLQSDPETAWVNLGLLSDMINAARTGSELAFAILTEINPDAAIVAIATHDTRAPPPAVLLSGTIAPEPTYRLFPAW